ncbi:MAG TPA: response regulator transcription factor [Candidatus Limnocylindrales bacterium]|nr:response regulator transcription factor [Candidatus Limnocylindrales bacterium]
MVDDEQKIAHVLQAYLEREGYAVVTAGDGLEALRLMHATEPDLIILDLMLPGLSGEEVCRRIRQAGSRVPVIMLTAKTTLEDKIYGLGLGADDYVVKPFSPQEVVARVKTILRRKDPDGALLTDFLILAGGDLVIDTMAHSITWREANLDLTPTEFNLLVHLARRPARVFSRAQLADSLFGYDSLTEDRAIDAHIKNLRQKMHIAGMPALIKTVYGVGYKYDER